jgi:uncharacterized protein
MAEHDKAGLTATAPAAVPLEGPLFSRAAWARILPFLTYVAFIVLGDVLERLGVPAAPLRWLYAAKIGAVVLVIAYFWREFEELRQPALRPGLAVAAAAAGVLVLLLWIALDAPWMSIGSSSGFDPRVSGGLDWPLVAVRLAGAALVVPLMEELFWRSFLMRWIVAADFQSVDPSQVKLKSFCITSVLFGFEHNLWLAGIVAGVAYGVLYLRHRTIWSPILAHAVTNGLLGVWVVATGHWSYW